MKGILKIFFGAEGTRPGFVLFCLVLAGLAEAVGLSTVLPAVTELSGGIQEKSSTLNIIILGFIESLGLTPSIETLIGLIAVGITSKAILSFAALSYVGYSVANVATGLRTRLISQLMGARWSYFTDRKVGQIANSISVDATRAGKAYMNSAKFVAHGLQAVVYAGVAFLVSWKLAVAGLVVGGLMAWSLNWLVQISKRAGRSQTFRTSDLVTYLSDTLSNIKPLKAMGRQAVFIAFMERKVRSLKTALRRQVVARQGRLYGEEIILTLTLAVGIYIAAVMWKIPFPELFVLGVIFFQVLSVVGKMQKILQTAVEVESAYWSVIALIDDSADKGETNPGKQTPTLETQCQFENVSFDYPGNTVVENVSFTIQAYGITVFKGPSGSGKTTLIDLLVGLHKPDHGRIAIDGTSLDDIDLSRWRNMIGYVPQEAALFHDTIRANITLGDENYTDADLAHVLKIAGLDEFVGNLPDGISTTVGERGTRFSGGQRQRIALARALITRPKLLILDEATSALDPETELEICGNIEQLCSDCTILSITHRPAWTIVATQLYEVSEGRVTPVLTDVSSRVHAQ